VRSQAQFTGPAHKDPRIEEIVMKKQRSIIYFTLLALLLTIGMACYWYLDGEKLPTVLEAAASILLAGLPIPLWLTGRTAARPWHSQGRSG
jgi:cation transport ATPase